MSDARGRLVLVRHGQTDHNVQGRLQGQVDIPLNATGRDQAMAVARTLSPHRFDLILSSPLSRAQDTAQAIADATGTREIATESDFIEQSFGDWEGLTGEEIHASWPDQHVQWRAGRTVPGLGIEDRSAVGERFARAARAVMREHAGATVLVVSHGAAIRAGVTALIGLDPGAFHGIGGMGNCHRSLLEPLHSDPTGRSMRLLSHNVPPDFT
jgi:broad specificity phosphatase PhoE